MSDLRKPQGSKKLLLIVFVTLVSCIFVVISGFYIFIKRPYSSIAGAYEQLKLGMTHEEVQKLTGVPDFVDTNDVCLESWSYWLPPPYSDINHIEFEPESGKTVAIYFEGRVSMGSEYLDSLRVIGSPCGTE